MKRKKFAKTCKLVGQKYPTIWKLVRKIKNEIKVERAQWALDALGEPRRFGRFASRKYWENSSNSVADFKPDKKKKGEQDVQKEDKVKQ